MNRPSPPPEAAKLLEAALDVFVYAPIGLLFEARDVVPKLAERGRGQVTLARFFGRYAIQLGQAEAERILKANRSQPEEPVGRRPEPPPAPTSTKVDDGITVEDTAKADNTAKGDSTAKADKAAKGAKVPPVAATPPEPVTAPSPAPEATPAADELPIPGYDTLSASQVVPRLDALRPDELEAIRAYETAHRGRRTILNRIAQRQA